MAHNLIARAPIAPDFHFCHPFYNLEPQPILEDCILAEARIPRSDIPKAYWRTGYQGHGDDPPHALPDGWIHGTCRIEVEVAYPPARNPHNVDDRQFFYATDNELREMAGWVISQCIAGSPSLGGFVTRNISRAIDHLSTTQIPFQDFDFGNIEHYPASVAFFTVTVTGEEDPGDLIMPGETDPTAGGKIATSLHDILSKTPFNSPSWDQLNGMAERVFRSWGMMDREGIDRWWWSGDTNGYGYDSDAVANEETTTYECDSTLGNPKVVDCSQLQYSAFPKGGDGNVHVRPYIPNFLHSDSCSIGISSHIPMTLSWARIEAAINDLVEVCVNNPLTTPIGGRAYYGHQDRVNMGGGELRKRERNSTALNALPPGLNITLFQQVEDLPVGFFAVDEPKSCTWRNAMGRKDVRDCAHKVRVRPRPTG